MKNPAMVLPDAMNGVQSLFKAMYSAGVPQQLLELVHLRASQINGCSACVYSGTASARKAGESEERIAAVAAWRETPFFTDAERVALEMTEAETRLSDRRGEAISDELWAEATKHFDEGQLAAIILMIATSNFFNRLNTSIKEPAGASWGG